MFLGRISNLERLVGCPGHRRLTIDSISISDKAKNAADHGSLMHRVMAGEVIDVPGEEEENLDQLRRLFVDWKHEIPVAYSPKLRVGKQFRSDKDLDTFVTDSPDGWLTGHIDNMLLGDGYANVHINDLKTSQLPVALDDLQLLGYCVAIAASIFDHCRIAGVKIAPFDTKLSVLHWPRSGSVRMDYMEQYGVPYKLYSRSVPLAELKAVADEVGKALLLDSEKLRIGGHCVYCPSIKYCPAQRPEYRG